MNTECMPSEHSDSDNRTLQYASVATFCQILCCVRSEDIMARSA